MSATLDYDALVRILRAGAARVTAGAGELGRLGSAIGDGDHGVAMTRAMEAIEAQSTKTRAFRKPLADSSLITSLFRCDRALVSGQPSFREAWGR